MQRALYGVHRDRQHISNFGWAQPFLKAQDQHQPLLLRQASQTLLQPLQQQRSEERRVGKECRSRWSPHHLKKKTTCWHVAVHPVQDVFYAISFRVAPADGRDWHECGMSYFLEYAYEICPETGLCLTHGFSGRE